MEPRSFAARVVRVGAGGPAATFLFHRNERAQSLTKLVFPFVILYLANPAYAVGNIDAGRQLVMRSCTSCHAAAGTATATDGAPPLSFIARDNKQNPAWIRAWLMDPHPPMPGIMLSRQQIDNIVSYPDALADEAMICDR